MNRRDFIAVSALSLTSMTFLNFPDLAWAKSRKDKNYSIVILGDTHFDTEPADVYHFTTKKWNGSTVCSVRNLPATVKCGVNAVRGC